MFRRKEDSLFDSPTDTMTAPAEAATVVSSHASSAPAAGTTSAPAASTTSVQQPIARPITEPRPSAPASSSSSSNAFRPSANSLGSEMTRNRMPDAKPTSGTTMTVEKGAKGTRRVLTVGNDILLKGEIATCDRLVIEGKVDATLNEVHTVEIAESGSFKGSAHIEDAEISGLFEGDLVVRNRLVIYATGKVRGKITYGEIEIERGGELTGEIKTISAQSSGPARPTRLTAKEDGKVAA